MEEKGIDLVELELIKTDGDCIPLETAVNIMESVCMNQELNLEVLANRIATVKKNKMWLANKQAEGYRVLPKDKFRILTDGAGRVGSQAPVQALHPSKVQITGALEDVQGIHIGVQSKGDMCPCCSASRRTPQPVVVRAKIKQREGAPRRRYLYVEFDMPEKRAAPDAKPEERPKALPESDLSTPRAPLVREASTKGSSAGGARASNKDGSHTGRGATTVNDNISPADVTAKRKSRRLEASRAAAPLEASAGQDGVSNLQRRSLLSRDKLLAKKAEGASVDMDLDSGLVPSPASGGSRDGKKKEVNMMAFSSSFGSQSSCDEVKVGDAAVVATPKGRDATLLAKSPESPSPRQLRRSKGLSQSADADSFQQLREEIVDDDNDMSEKEDELSKPKPKPKATRKAPRTRSSESRSGDPSEKRRKVVKTTAPLLVTSKGVTPPPAEAVATPTAKMSARPGEAPRDTSHGDKVDMSRKHCMEEARKVKAPQVFKKSSFRAQRPKPYQAIFCCPICYVWAADELERDPNGNWQPVRGGTELPNPLDVLLHMDDFEGAAAMVFSKEEQVYQHLLLVHGMRRNRMEPATAQAVEHHKFRGSNGLVNAVLRNRRHVTPSGNDDFWSDDASLRKLQFVLKLVRVRGGRDTCFPQERCKGPDAQVTWKLLTEGWVGGELDMALYTAKELSKLAADPAEDMDGDERKPRPKAPEKVADDAFEDRAAWEKAGRKAMLWCGHYRCESFTFAYFNDRLYSLMWYYRRTAFGTRLPMGCIDRFADWIRRRPAEVLNASSLTPDDPNSFSKDPWAQFGKDRVVTSSEFPRINGLTWWEAFNREPFVCSYLKDRDHPAASEIDFINWLNDELAFPIDLDHAPQPSVSASSSWKM
ncbi:unnamed protein product [Durusdinium trenchii]|uniref:DNA-directed RNA polymerase n=1 Tax=Durusdinium trenchii TaxID=1381693 RepID=A0ABP0I8P1_9DINO